MTRAVGLFTSRYRGEGAEPDPQGVADLVWIDREQEQDLRNQRRRDAFHRRFDALRG